MKKRILLRITQRSEVMYLCVVGHGRKNQSTTKRKRESKDLGRVKAGELVNME